jgi:hypothetical protein
MQIGCAALRSRYVDHHAAAVAQHLRNLVLHAHERAAQVDVEDAVPLIEGDLVDESGLVLDAGIVEGAVDAIEPLDRFGDRCLDLIRLRHVAPDREHLPAIRFDLDAKLIERSLGTVSMC